VKNSAGREQGLEASAIQDFSKHAGWQSHQLPVQPTTKPTEHRQGNSKPRWGGPVEEIRPGDVVWIPPGEKHWHGAAPTTAMTHIAIQEKHEGKVVDWMEQVSDEQYKVAP
jgi:hypothetical protein